MDLRVRPRKMGRTRRSILQAILLQALTVRNLPSGTGSSRGSGWSPINCRLRCIAPIRSKHIQCQGIRRNRSCASRRQSAHSRSCWPGRRSASVLCRRHAHGSAWQIGSAARRGRRGNIKGTIGGYHIFLHSLICSRGKATRPRKYAKRLLICSE